MNKLEIKHKRTNEIIMTIEYENSISEANLRGLDLYGANLYKANLRGVDLYGANLREANLYEANLREADLRGVDLREATLREADFYEANLRGADLREANLYEANLREADLSGVDLSGVDLYGANLRAADLREAKNINYGNLIGSNIHNISINTNDVFIEIMGYKFTAYIFKNYMRIGCKSFSHSEWIRFWKFKELDSGEIFKEYFSQEQLEMIYTCVKKQNDKLKKVKDNENTE